MGNKFSVISRLAVVTTLLGTKEVARGQQQDFEGRTCDSSDNFLSGTAYTNCQSEPFGGAPITLRNIATDPIILDPSAITAFSFPCNYTELKDNIMSYWQRQIKSDEPAKEKTPDDEVHKAAARAAAIALAAKDVGTQQLNRRTFCKSCNQHVTDHMTITCPRGKVW
ncbi:hypothetical protein RI054_10g53510 [Pseudoscourfieldia marina]